MEMSVHESLREAPGVSGDPASRRADLVRALFPDGVPRLWCPPLTHYRRDGSIDRERCAAHLGFITQWSQGLFVPGSTGDGWELSPAETREVTDLALAEAARLGARVLVGALHPNALEAAEVIAGTQARLKGGPLRRNICGFAVCPPRGKRRSQDELGEALSDLLNLGAPVALYQLPQVTQNEMSPGLLRQLTGRFANAILFKDSSGGDRVAEAGPDLGGMFLVRGAEGDYARHLKPNGGGYDGLLLSTANSFGAQLAEIIEHSHAGRAQEAERLSGRLSSLVATVFGFVQDFPDGNPFANAAKAVDHFFAHGPGALTAPRPRLHAGSHLPLEVLRATGEALDSHGLLPTRGYLG